MECLAHCFRKRRRSSASFLFLEKNMASPAEDRSATMEERTGSDPVQSQPTASRWRRVFGGKAKEDPESGEGQTYRSKSTLGILSDKETDEVPGEYTVPVTERSNIVERNLTSGWHVRDGTSPIIESQ
jgi:hypothetical protein